MNKTLFLESHNLRNLHKGLGVFNYKLIQAFAKMDLSEMELTINTDDISRFKEEFGSQFKYQKYYSFQRHTIFRLRKKYDLWHSLNQNTKIEPYHNPKNYVLTLHDILTAEKDEKGRNFLKTKLERSNAIIYISNYVKEQTHQFFDVPKITEVVIYNGNSITEILDTTAVEGTSKIDFPYIYSISDFLERKNFLSLIKLIEFTPDLKLILSGNNDRAYGYELSKYVSDHKLNDKVIFTGRVSELQKQFYIKNCLAFVFPSLQEGFGFPVIEAMKFGKPIFVSRLTSLPEIGGDVVYYWDNFDPENMLDVLFDGLNDYENNREERIIAIKKRADFFNWDTTAKRYLDLYKTLLK